MKKIKCIFSLFIAVLIITSCGAKHSTNQKTEILKIDLRTILKIDSIFSRYNDNTPGSAIAIIQDNEIVFMKSYGMADPKRKISITPETKFLIGSNTKQFTCMAILLLEESGKLNINDPIRKYLPQLPKYADSVTIHQLMQHTSGIIEYNPLLFLSGIKKHECELCNDDIFDLVSKYQKTCYKPGDKFFYSNTAYILLSKIIEKASLKTYSDFLHENIFVPLEMNNSEVVTSPNDYKDAAIGFNHITGYQPVNCRMITSGATGIISTLQDMCKWINNYSANKLGISDQLLVNKMVKKGLLNNGDSTKYGLGLFIDNYCTNKVYWHGGNITGYTSNITMFPEENTSIIVLSNNMDMIPYEHRFDVAKILFGDCKMQSNDLFLENELRVEFKKKQSEFDNKTVESNEFEGKYETPGFTKHFEIIVINGRLVAKIDNLEFKLNQAFKDTFISEPMIFEFQRDSGNIITGILLSGEKFRNLELAKI